MEEKGGRERGKRSKRKKSTASERQHQSKKNKETALLLPPPAAALAFACALARAMADFCPLPPPICTENEREQGE